MEEKLKVLNEALKKVTSSLRQKLIAKLIWLSGVKREKGSLQPFFKRFCFFCLLTQGAVRDGILFRRLITLIFAGWVPHDLASSRSCLALRSEVRPGPYSYSFIEGSPERDRVSGCALGTDVRLTFVASLLADVFDL